jgi:hypothetical protein
MCGEHSTDQKVVGLTRVSDERRIFGATVVATPAAFATRILPRTG